MNYGYVSIASIGTSITGIIHIIIFYPNNKTRVIPYT